MNEKKPTMPARTLLQGKPYVPAASTDLAALFRRIKNQQKAEEWARKENLPI